MATNPHDIHLTPDEWKLLAELASSTGKPPEVVVSEALRSYEAQQLSSSENGRQPETLFQRLDKKGLIGCIKGAPPDLSTNPKYMEGFGESNR
ncbi:MAG: hypothetical protein WD669_07290 [Pirellulales bacterium]